MKLNPATDGMRSTVIGAKLRKIDGYEGPPVYVVTVRYRRNDGEVFCQQHRFESKKLAKRCADARIRQAD